jgi:hypothetical protein
VIPSSLRIDDGLDKHILADNGNRSMTLGTKEDRRDRVEVVDCEGEVEVSSRLEEKGFGEDGISSPPVPGGGLTVPCLAKTIGASMSSMSGCQREEETRSAQSLEPHLVVGQRDGDSLRSRLIQDPQHQQQGLQSAQRTPCRSSGRMRAIRRSSGGRVSENLGFEGLRDSSHWR